MMFKQKRRRNSSFFKSNQIAIEDLSNELIPITGSRHFAILVHNLLSREECANLVRRADDEGFDDALIQGPGGRQVLERDVRSCGRCIIDDPGLADAIYVRLTNALRGTQLEDRVSRAPWAKAAVAKAAAAAGGGGGGEQLTAVGLNERMRFLKYKPGHFFAPHRDLRFVRAGPDAGDRAGETSHTTVQLYLNDKFKGGTTRFISGKRHYDVRPRTGSALIFDHDILHQGSEVTSGIKYSLRTDIMYATLPPPAAAATTMATTTMGKDLSKEVSE